LREIFSAKGVQVLSRALYGLADLPAKSQAREVHAVRTSVMANGPEERLDRRDFVIASIATVGASAALAANAGSANAQNAATSSVGPATGASSATVYTGDTIQGKKVVSALDINDLEPRQEALFVFSGR
jgi:hypothetical protein